MLNLPPQDFMFIADEAGISNDRYTVVGGILVKTSSAEQIYRTLSKYREEYRMHAELKWTKISNGKLAEYQQFVDYFFALNNSNNLHFHAIIFDNHRWNHKKFNKGDGDIGLSKLYYQLILHKFIKKIKNKGTLFVRLDHRNSTTSLEEIKKMLNIAATKNKIEGNPLKQLVSSDSKECDLLQLNDVILGGVCSIRNGKHLLEGGNEAKKIIARKILTMSGLADFTEDTPNHIKRFTLWNMRAQK